MNNKVCELLDIEFPILQGGMGNISDPVLAAAVSEAGGLGTLGVGTLPVKEVQDRLAILKQKTKYPICLNIPIAVHPDVKAIADLAVSQQVPVVSLSAGNPAPWIPFFHEHGIKVICVIATVKHAKKAEEAGADIIVCEGYEAAGINALSETTTMTLVPQIVNAVKTPVVAAGGIGDGRGLAAVLMLGAEGVQMGTRLIATEEAPYHLKYKKALKEAQDDATVIVGRRYKQVRRIMNTDYAKQLADLEVNTADIESYQRKTDESRHIRGAIEGDLEEGFINAGQISGLINDCPSVSQLFKGMIEEAKMTMAVAVNKI